MNSAHRSTKPLLAPSNDNSETKPKSPPESLVTGSPSSPLAQGPPTVGKSTLVANLLMVWPLIAHFFGSVAIAVGVLKFLDGSQYYLERQPRIMLADGTYQSLGGRHLLQSDITTIISVSLMIVRWTAAAWAAPLCWRVIFLLAEGNGLYRRDIEWVINYAILPPTTHFRRPLNLMLGIIMIFTLAPYPSSPLLTGSISWSPDSLTTHPLNIPSINITGGEPNIPRFESVWRMTPMIQPTFPTKVVRSLNAAWTRSLEEHTFKRVITPDVQLALNSTIDRIVVPYFAVTGIKWLPNMREDTAQFFDAMRYDQQNFPNLSGKMYQSCATTLIANGTYETSPPATIPTSWPVLINVAKDVKKSLKQSCSPTDIILPPNSTIPLLELELNATDPQNRLYGCFAYANVTFRASHGLCNSCRISSYSTVQNDTELTLIDIESSAATYRFVSQLASRDMPLHAVNMASLDNSLPDPASDLEVYIKALLVRLYSAIWNSWVDSSIIYVSSKYKPAAPTLRASVSQIQAYGWFTIQLLFTLAGLAFLWLQSDSRYPLIANTKMVAFDTDTTDAPKPGSSSKRELNELLRIEPKDNGWKVIVPH